MCAPSKRRIEYPMIGFIPHYPAVCTAAGLRGRLPASIGGAALPSLSPGYDSVTRHIHVFRRGGGLRHRGRCGPLTVATATRPQHAPAHATLYLSLPMYSASHAVHTSVIEPPAAISFSVQPGVARVPHGAQSESCPYNRSRVQTNYISHRHTRRTQHTDTHSHTHTNKGDSSIMATSGSGSRATPTGLTSSSRPRTARNQLREPES